jgi:hypothetical protein
MKKKKLKKLVNKLVSKRVRERDRNEDIISDYNPEVSKKIKDLLMDCLNYYTGNNIKFFIYSDRLECIVNDVTKLKLTTAVTTYSDSNYVSISLYKDKILIIRGYNQFFFADNELYKEFSPIIRKKLESSINEFNILYDGIIMDSGLLRDKNLDDLLDN